MEDGYCTTDKNNQGLARDIEVACKEETQGVFSTKCSGKISIFV